MPPKIASFFNRPGLTSWPSSGGAASSGSSAFFGFLAMRPPTPSDENAAGEAGRYSDTGQLRLMAR